MDLKTGEAAAVSIGQGWQASITVECRRATELEMKRQDGTEALMKAERGTKFSALHAALIRGRASHVEAALLERCEKKKMQLEVAGGANQKSGCNPRVLWPRLLCTSLCSLEARALF